jgi:hypothetical protein
MAWQARDQDANGRSHHLASSVLMYYTGNYSYYPGFYRQGGVCQAGWPGIAKPVCARR